MSSSWRAFLAAIVTAGVINLAGVLLFFDRVASHDAPSGPIVPSGVGFLVYVLLSVALFAWAARQTQSAYKAAFIVGASQFLLVNVDFVLAGKRGVMTGLASTALLVVTWGCVAFVYSFCLGRQQTNSKST